METEKFRLDIAEHDAITRILKALFGIVCIAVAVITAFRMTESGLMTYGTAAAVAFLFLFGIWLVLAGLSLTERYMTISGDSIILKEKPLARARYLKASEIRKIGFSQLKLSFYIDGGEVIHLRLGAYYRENSLLLMEAIEEYCTLNGVSTSGIRPETGEAGHEA